MLSTTYLQQVWFDTKGAIMSQRVGTVIWLHTCVALHHYTLLCINSAIAHIKFVCIILLYDHRYLQNLFPIKMFRSKVLTIPCFHLKRVWWAWDKVWDGWREEGGWWNNCQMQQCWIGFSKLGCSWLGLVDRRNQQIVCMQIQKDNLLCWAWVLRWVLQPLSAAATLLGWKHQQQQHLLPLSWVGAGRAELASSAVWVDFSLSRWKWTRLMICPCLAGQSLLSTILSLGQKVLGRSHPPCEMERCHLVIIIDGRALSLPPNLHSLQSGCHLTVKTSTLFKKSIDKVVQTY